MKCNFHVGQKVVMAVAFKPHVADRAKDEGVTLPVQGVVYTIRDMEAGEGWNVGKTYLRFNELINGPHVSDGIEPSFDASMFRPVVERKTDISIFKAMLNPSRVEERA